MKKKLLGGIAILAIAVVVAINVNLNTNSNNLSDLSLANVEALASSESDGDFRCYNNISSDGDQNLTHLKDCDDCTPVLCRTWSDSSICGN